MGKIRKNLSLCHIEGNDLSGRLHHVTTIMIIDLGPLHEQSTID